MNSVNIIGRVGSEIELRYTPSGKAVTDANLAVDDGFGENKKTVWIGVTIWGATAELAAKAVHKGDRLAITGRLSQEQWADRETGKTVRKTRVTCETMHLIEKRRESATPPQSTSTAPESGEEEDIPF